jgi:acyl-coenzyme A synthetase/AMP-(fatty) acid ligase
MDVLADWLPSADALSSTLTKFSRARNRPIFVEELPKTASGKIQPRVLRDREYAQARQRRRHE